MANEITVDEVETFIAEEYGLTLEKFLEIRSKARVVREACDYQSHLHGETEPTPPDNIALESMIVGYKLACIDINRIICAARMEAGRDE